jgi:hypothetical protein
MLKEAEVVVSGDEHVGSTMGIMPSCGITFKSGNKVLPNRLQEEMIGHWDAAWQRVAQSPKPRVLIRVGDIIEGLHNGMAQVWGTPLDQLEAAESLYSPLMQFFKHRFSVNGTPVHVGEEGCADEALAIRLGFDEVGGRRSNAQLRVSISGVLFDVSHEGPRAGSKIWNVGNSLRSFARDLVMRDVMANLTPPRVIVRAHGHRACHEHLEVDIGRHECVKVDAFLTPAWKARDDYAHKVSNYLHLSDVGLLAIHVSQGNVTGYRFDCLEFPDIGDVAV